MARALKCKHVMKEMYDFSLPKEDQMIVKVVSSRGNNLHEVESPADNGKNFLVSMPNKFRKNVWVKRGDYLVIDPIVEGDKVKGEIFRILTSEHIKEYQNEGVWPKKFTKKREHEEDENFNDLENGDELMFGNLNRKRLEISVSEDSEEEEDNEDEEAYEDEEDEYSSDDSVRHKFYTFDV